jgi:signal transduction histidine kinase
MTIKKRIHKSNIRMALITILVTMLIMAILRVLLSLFIGIPIQGRGPVKDFEPGNWGAVTMLLFIVLFTLIIGIVNNYLTYRLTKKIFKPLEPLSEGVRQIHDGNLSCRIEYREDDEFRPLCDAFNEMAVWLENNARDREKYESNRRELIAGISHDLRTPLTSIKGYLEGLETGVAATSEMRAKYFTIIKNKTIDMEHIIEQLFLFSKLDMDEFPLALRRVDIALALRDIIEEMIPEYSMRGVYIHLAKIQEKVFVSLDTMLLRNVIINIFENSLKYKTKEYANIEAGCSIVDNSLLVRFADDGPGVNSEALPQLFDVFYRADPSRNKKGSGLGLAISAKIVKLMGGEIQAELPPEGGLAISICLPLLKEHS